MEDLLRDVYTKIETIISKSFILFYHIICKPQNISCLDIYVQNFIFYSSPSDLQSNDNYMTLYQHPLISCKVYELGKSYEPYETDIEDNEINMFNIKKTPEIHLEFEIGPTIVLDDIKHLSLKVY